MLKNEKSANRNEHQNRKTEVFQHKNRKTDLKNSQNRKTENPNVPHLQEQFIDFQLLSDDDIPLHVWNGAIVKTDEDGTPCLFQMDVILGHLNSTKSADGALRFDLLARVALTVLCLPHSNAEEERVFSMIGKNKRAERSSLQVKGTLSSIMTVKLADLNAKTFTPPASVLKAAKSATYEYNKAHKRKL